MPRTILFVSVVACALGACGHNDTQWLKVNEPYTTAEFQRDYAACAKGVMATLDEDCMRAKGWTAVQPSRGDRAADTPPPPPVDYRHKRTP